jgi:hypothetical protein
MPAAEIEPSFLRQHTVGFRNSVVVHSEVDGEASHRGKRVANGKHAVHQECPNGIRDLPIRRHGGGEIDSNDNHGFYCMLSADNRQCPLQMSTSAREAYAGHRKAAPINPSLGFAMGWPVMPRDGAESHEHVGSYGAYVAYATIQASRDLAVGAFANLGGGQDLRDAVANVALQIATRITTDKK